jgi:ribosomal protein S3AE
VGGETYRTVGKIVADIVENKMSEVSYKDIVSEHVNEAELNLIGNRRGRKRKRVRGGGNF